MKALLDTHAFLWMVTDDERLSRRARKVIADGNNELFLSAASAWELVLKAQARKLELDGGAAVFLREELGRNAISLLPIGLPHVLQLAELPPLHRDPFDRLLIAQAQVEGLPVLTADRTIKKYAVQTIW